MSSGEFAVNSDGAFELVYCFGQKSRFAVGPAKDNMQLRTVAELFEHASKDLLRGSQLMLLEICESQRVGDVIIVGRYFQRRLEFGRCFSKIAEHEMTLAQHLVRA